ncbi:MAG: phospho-N-acetylmuramoyl-pentapeptide-transferase [Oscillospiraceae bacterium]|nr:phospho-N-acetylmuramoyl-pentapeptide-transferase [Oscillospiraceae bacterium]
MNTWMIVAALAAFGVTALSGLVLVPWLRKLKYGQTILDIGPKWHEKKQGTPTMGGIMFMLGITVAVAVCWPWMAKATGLAGQPDASVMGARVLYGMIMALLFGLIGFLDDYIKVVKKQNMGLTAKQKMAMQLAVSAAYIIAMQLNGGLSTIVDIPFLGQLDLGWLFYPFAIVIIIAGTVNAVNLSDGLDGLASSLVFVAALAFLVIATMLQRWGAALMSAALAAGSIGFLVWNFYPAKVFMCDTGSLVLVGMLVAIAFGLGLPIFLVPVGIVFICEVLSVVIQTTYFKLTHGKRIFKMSPIHHHFEMCGMTEVQIVMMFSAVGVLGGVLAVLAAAVL